MNKQDNPAMNIASRPRLLRNLQIGFGLSLLLLIITAVASYSSISNLMVASKWVDHTDSVIIKTDRAMFVLRDAESGQRGFLLTGDSTFLQDFNGALDTLHEIIDSIGEMTADNPSQVQNIRDLRAVIDQPLVILGQVIEQKKSDNIYSLQQLERARGYSLQARAILQRMEKAEHQLLATRIISVRKYSAYTPVLIIVAAALSILITLVFYWRVHNDYLERSALYAELKGKDADISRRIGIIGGIADKISEGNYRTRVSDEQKDSLGELAGSLNKMAESLEYSFGLLSEKEWLQTGIARLNDVMVGETDMRNLVTNVIEFIAEYTRSKVGALYLLDPEFETLTLQGHYALRTGGSSRQPVRIGEGIAGQAALKGKKMQLRDIDAGDWVVSFTAGEVRPRNIIAIPFFYEKRVKGVIELGSMEEYMPRDLEFLGSIGDNIGIAIHSIETRLRLQELLEETQAQTEELQSQHGELESLNMELETQAEKLQVSEEELKVQQEELLQTNQELEERSRSLEEKNQLILIRNLEIQKKAEELTLTTKYKSEFMANMSHELRTPLNSILLLSRLLSENGGQNLSAEQIEYARVIQNSGQGLLQLIDEILDLSRIEAGKLPLEHTIVPVAEIIEDMRSLFGPIANDKNLELNFVTLERAPAQVETDKMRLEQILKNLLSNAFKFTSKGSVTLTVGPSAAHPNFIGLTVRDTGIGIPKDKHQLIFEAFQQADGSTRRKYGGTGLGLSISRELAKLLGGEITLTSQPGEGAEFIVTIPQFKMAAGELSAAAPVTGPVREARPAGLPENGSVLTLSEVPAEIPDDRDNLAPGDKVLLIVEDDTLFAGSLLEFTRKKGYKGIVAVSGDAGIRMARRFLPIGILLDVQLPVKNGWEVMDELKKDPHTRLIPVHIVSSFEVKSESLQKGAVDFLSKPMAFENMDNVFERIEYYLNRNARKVLIVEDNSRHAQALAYFLGIHHVRMELAGTIADSIALLKEGEIHGVILSREAGKEGVDTLETVRKNPDLADIPIIVFTGMNISKSEEARLRQYADSIVVKTAHSYQRVLDEVSLFLHVVAEGKEEGKAGNNGRMGALGEVLRNKTVLIADDDVRNIFSLTKALEQHKMKVLTAMDGKEAISAAEDGKVDIVLMDMMMPEMDGFEAITRLRKMPRFRHLPIIAVTAKAMAGDREKCIQAGASDYISKPVDIDQLLSLLRIWLYEK
jgi:signal transduction histidine kinase/DNA-binding response OmpR family regulator/CHASE3 domain sensor protein